MAAMSLKQSHMFMEGWVVCLGRGILSREKYASPKDRRQFFFLNIVYTFFLIIELAIGCTPFDVKV